MRPRHKAAEYKQLQGVVKAGKLARFNEAAA